MRLLYVTYAGVALAIAGVELAIAPDGRLAALPWAAACGLAVAAIGWGVVHHSPPRRRVWVYIAAAIAAWGAAAALFPLLGLTATTTDYHVADLLYVPGYLGIALAAGALVRQMGPLRLAGLEAAIGGLTASMFLWSTVIEPYVGTFGFSRAVTAVFPLCDIALLMLILRLLFSPASQFVATRLLVAATVLLVVSDVAYFSPVITKGATAGRLIAAGYVLAYTAFGAAALHPSMRRVPQPATEEVSPRRLLVLLACAPLAMPLALTFNVLVIGTSEAFDLALIGAAIIVLVMVRIGGLLRHLVSLRAQAEATEQKFRMVFDSAGVGISIGDGGFFSLTNESLQRLLGYSAEELRDMHYSAVTYPEDLAVDREMSALIESRDAPSVTFEKRYVHKDGHLVWAEVTLTRALDDTFGIALVTDISARKQLEEELRQAQKMEAVGQLAGGIAHDFNNVMAAVSGCADLLLDELGEDDPRRARAQVISQSADRATDLTRQLLAFSRRQVLRLEPLDLADVVRRMRPLFERLLPPSVGVEYDLRRGGVARIDGSQFEQVLLNLVLNARDALPGGGTIRISVRGVGETAELVVADDGIGIDDETRARIFDPFFTTKPTGTGLGLSTVDGIVGQSGGTISVATTRGGGTAFTIHLPLADEEPNALEPAPPEPAGRVAPGRVLLADDEELVRRVTAEMLRRCGYEVVQAESGAEAFERLAEGEFDILVTDVAMSGMDGAALARRARELRRGLPVLFISGYPADLLARDRLVGEHDEVLTKPFTPKQLAERIELVRRSADAVAA
ncbi:MAG TPA: ATP-binding protein [Gaiellaceae bacterium]|nr:ATP-binding protein [Gaiellaceae bacterium]